MKAARLRALRALRRLAGLCTHCDAPHNAGRTLCSWHLSDQREAQRKHRNARDKVNT